MPWGIVRRCVMYVLTQREEKSEVCAILPATPVCAVEMRAQGMLTVRVA
jgi:hypothetical protein